MRRIELKCRRCGGIDVSLIVHKRLTTGDHLEGQAKHECPDGGIGVFEFQGLTPDGAESEGNDV